MGFAPLNSSYLLSSVGAEVNETLITPRRVLAAIKKARQTAARA